MDLTACGWLSIDSALSTSETADYSALTLGYSVAGRHYIVHTERGRWDFDTLRDKALAYETRLGALTFIVEYAGSGISLIMYMKKRAKRIFWHKPGEDKVTRAARVLPIFAEGRVFVVRRKGQDAWIEPWMNEMLSFPNGRFDDQVDSIVQALHWAEPRANPGSRVWVTERAER